MNSWHYSCSGYLWKGYISLCCLQESSFDSSVVQSVTWSVSQLCWHTQFPCFTDIQFTKICSQNVWKIKSLFLGKLINLKHPCVTLLCQCISRSSRLKNHIYGIKIFELKYGCQHHNSRWFNIYLLCYETIWCSLKILANRLAWHMLLSVFLHCGNLGVRTKPGTLRPSRGTIGI